MNNQKRKFKKSFICYSIKKEDPWLIHVNVWRKPLQYCKVISLQLIKINEKKKKVAAFEKKKKDEIIRNKLNQGGERLVHLKKKKTTKYCWEKFNKIPW